MRFYTSCNTNPVMAIILAFALTMGVITTASPQAEASTPHDGTLHILSLGDSFTSGIGTFDTRESTNALGHRCLQGSTSQTTILRQDLVAKGWNVHLNDDASCLGYRVEDIHSYLQTNAGSRSIAQADVVYLGIGGNDIGFVPRIACMTAAFAASSLSDIAGVHGADAELLMQPCLANRDGWVGASTATAWLRIENLLKDIADKADSGTTVFVKNYPDIFGSQDHGDWASFEHACWKLSNTFGSETQALIRDLTQDLNQAIEDAVNNVDGRNGVTIELLDINFLYEGHGYCGLGEDWINGLDTLTGAISGLDTLKNTLHPQLAGYEAEAQWYEAMLGRHYEKRDFDGSNYVEIPWGPYIGDILKYDDGSPQSWLVTATGLRHIHDGGDFLCFLTQGATLHRLSRGFIDSLPQGDDIRCTPDPVVPTGPNVYGDLPLVCGTHVPYASTYDTYLHFHHGHALDFPAPQGTQVVAPVDGTISVKSNPGGYGNYIDLTADDGTVHRFAHLLANGLAANGSRVQKSDVIGLVGSTGASTGPHLHYERRVNGSQVVIHFDGDPLAWGPRYTSGGDRTTTHPLISGNCDATSSNSSNTQPQLRIAALGAGGCLFVKEDALDTNWVKQLCGVEAFELEEDRIAVLTDTSSLLVKEGALDATWVRQASYVVDFDLEKDRIAVVRTNGDSLVKEGALSTSWTQVHSNTVDIQLSQARIYVLQSNGDLLVKTPYIDSRWVTLYNNVDSFTLAYQRVIARQTNGSIIAKEGSISAPWVTLWDTPVDSFMATSKRIMIEINGSIWVKDGALDAKWVQLSSGGVAHFDMTQYRVITAGNGLIQGKEPRLDSPWRVLMESHALDVDAEAGYIGFVSGDGFFFAKGPRLNSPWVRMLDGVRAIEFETW